MDNDIISVNIIHNKNATRKNKLFTSLESCGIINAMLGKSEYTYYAYYAYYAEWRVLKQFEWRKKPEDFYANIIL